MLRLDERTRLLTELELGQTFVLVRADTVQERREVLRWLRANLPSPEARLEVVEFEGIGDPIDAILEAGQGASLVVATGDEVLADAERSSWLSALNGGRDRLAALGASLILLVDDVTLDELAQQAPDFWSWHGGVYEGERSVLAAPERGDDGALAAGGSGGGEAGNEIPIPPSGGLAWSMPAGEEAAGKAEATGEKAKAGTGEDRTTRAEVNVQEKAVVAGDFQGAHKALSLGSDVGEQAPWMYLSPEEMDELPSRRRLRFRVTD